VFTGIIEETGQVRSMQKTNSGYELTITCRGVLEGTRMGDSIATNGVCLTVIRFDSRSFTAGVSPETLGRSNLSKLRQGDVVNLERAVTPSTRLGGHFVQGHVDCEGVIRNVERDAETLRIRIDVPSETMRYIVEKGFISVDGASLTVVGTFVDGFQVMLVAFTQSIITLAGRKNGESVNIEVDILGKYVEKLLARNGSSLPGVTKTQNSSFSASFLEENGFM
jgi:riboflavin synthase